MSDVAFRRKLADRAAVARVVVTPSETDQLEKYFDLLKRWSARMNLTALPFSDLPDKTIDRLLIEPLAAARYVTKSPITWVDVGSGGGSPAIPLKVIRNQARLVMVESKSRKAAFLREAVRALKLNGTDVQNSRFEDLVEPKPPKILADLVTVRAVRADETLLALCRLALRPEGELLLFQSDMVDGQTPTGFKRLRTVQLTETPAFLDILKAV
jgi:16S rRNA (guanine527-N7)-methyltransferase